MADDFARMHYPGESPEYRQARNTLLAAEIALRRQTEAVAEMRRALPPGGEVPEDYVFERIGAFSPRRRCDCPNCSASFRRSCSTA